MSIEAISIAALLQKEFPPSDLILGGELLDKSGAMLVSGPQKVGKSLLAGQLALSIAARQPFLTFQPGEADYRVLGLQAEVSEKRMQERYRKQAGSFGEGAQERVLNACVFSSVKLNRQDSLREVKEAVQRYTPDILVIDPLVNFHTGDENDAGDMARVTSALDEIRGDGVAVILVHHHGKSSVNQANVGHKSRGSSVLPGWYDTHLSLEWAAREAKKVKCRFELRHGEAPEDIILKLNRDTLLFEVQSDEAAQITLVVSTVEDLGDATADQIAERCGRTRQWASEWSNRAVQQGRLDRQGDRPVFFRLRPANNEIRVELPDPDAYVLSTNTTTIRRFGEEEEE